MSSIRKVATMNPLRFALRPSQAAPGPLPLMAAGGQCSLWQPSGRRKADRENPTLLVLEGLDRVGVGDPQGADHDDADDYGQDDDVGGDEEQR